jgi:hypothetical protein
MIKQGKMVFSAIPEIAPERMAILRAELLKFLIGSGAPPDYSIQSLQIEQELGLSRDEMRAVHMKILTEGLIAERARMGHIGLSERGLLIARRLTEA